MRALDYYMTPSDVWMMLDSAIKKMEYIIYIRSGDQTIMPLKKSKSKAALQENIKTEINSGKKPSQAAAIAYSVQRQAKKGKK